MTVTANWRPNLALPPQVVGCGGRNTPCLGGSQVPIVNPMIPLNINNNNIAPINIRTRNPMCRFTIQKDFPQENQELF